MTAAPAVKRHAEHEMPRVCVERSDQRGRADLVVAKDRFKRHRAAAHAGSPIVVDRLKQHTCLTLPSSKIHFQKLEQRVA